MNNLTIYILPLPGPRAYSLGLNIRGQYAFRYFANQGRFPTLWSALLKEGVQSDSFFLHLGQNKFQIRKPAEQSSKFDPNIPPPTLLIQRNKLCGTVLTHLEREHSSSGRFNAFFDCKLADVSLSTRQAILEDGRVIDYDLLIGEMLYQIIKSADKISQSIVLIGVWYVHRCGWYYV